MNGKLMIDGTARPGQNHLASSTVAILAILVLVLVASGLLLWQDTATRVPAALNAASSSPGANPELLVARRYAAAQRALAFEASRDDPSFLGANPELLKPAPSAAYPAAARAFLAANPELSVVRRYGGLPAGN